MPCRTVLTPAQRDALFAVPIREPDLIRHWTLGAADLAAVRQRRRPGNRLGFALQLWALRYLGRLLRPGEVIPAEAFRFVADQLGTADDGHFLYDRANTRCEQLDIIEIRQAAEVGPQVLDAEEPQACWQQCDKGLSLRRPESWKVAAGGTAVGSGPRSAPASRNTLPRPPLPSSLRSNTPPARSRNRRICAAAARGSACASGRTLFHAMNPRERWMVRSRFSISAASRVLPSLPARTRQSERASAGSSFACAISSSANGRAPSCSSVSTLSARDRVALPAGARAGVAAGFLDDRRCQA